MDEYNTQYYFGAIQTPLTFPRCLQ